MWNYCLVVLLFSVLLPSTEAQQDFYCHEPVDVALLLDSSRSLGRDNFSQLKLFAKNFVTFFRVSKDIPAPHIGVIPYSDLPITKKNVINFYKSASVEFLSKKIDGLKYENGRHEARLDNALSYTRGNLFHSSMGGRTWVPRVVLVVTGSFQRWTESMLRNIQHKAKLLRKENIKVVVAAVGTTHSGDVAKLESLVDERKDLYLVRFSFGLLQVAEDIVRRMCPVPVVLPCSGVVDIAFIVDSSGSINKADYIKTKYFVFSIANALNISENGAHAGVVIYSTIARMVISFKDYNNIAGFQKAVYKLEHMKKFTRIDLGLREAHTVLFNEKYGGARSYVKKIAFILTDGKQNPDQRGLDVSVGEAAKPLMDDNIKTFSIGIGSGVDKDELRAMVEFDEDVITVKNFDELLKRIQNITQQTCEEITYSKCNYPADFAFVLDSSTAVTDFDFEQSKGLVKTMAKLFRIHQYGSRGAVIVYGARAEMAIALDEHKNYRNYVDAVGKLKRVGGRRRTYKALGLAEDVLSDYSSGARRKVPKVVLLITGGPESSGLDFTALQDVASGIHDRQMLVLVVGVGPGMSVPDTKTLVQSTVNLFLAKSFTELRDKLVPLSNETCKNVGPGGICEAKLDLAFILDSSGSIEEDEFEAAKNFVRTVAKTFWISPQQTHVALMIYSDEARIISKFGRLNSQDDLRRELDVLPHLRGKTRIDLALKKAGTELFSWNGGMRTSSSVAKVAIVITDGRQSPAPDGIRLDEAAANLLLQGVKVLSIGVGDNIDQYELNMMVEDPKKHTFWAESYRALRVQLATIARESCSRQTFTGPNRRRF